MNQFDEKVVLYTKSLDEKCSVEANNALLCAVTQSLRPSIYNADAKIVAAREEDKANTLKENFVKKKLGFTDQTQVDAGVEKTFKALTGNVNTAWC